MTTTLAETRTKVITLRAPEHLDLNGNAFEVPNFTMKDIRDAIPKHCYRKSDLRSMSYVLRDFFYMAALIYTTYNLTPLIPNMAIRALIYAAQVCLSGMIMTGIWILAHECGHFAFSESKPINMAMGYILHTVLLVPFHSWRIAHGHHHKATSNLNRDAVFVPHSRDSWVKNYVGAEADPHTVGFGELAEDAPLVHLWKLFQHQVLGWPGYMIFNLSAQPDKMSFPQNSHYWFGSDSEMYKKHELSLVLQSDLGIVLMTWALYNVAQMFGWWAVTVFYILPYLTLNHWVVLITYLHHTDATLPRYANFQWTFARGASATIDRDFGWIDTHLFHRILSTHVLHHLVSTIPHYHAVEATEAIKKVMGKHYNADLETPLFKAFWKTYRDCQFVEETKGADGSGVFFFRNLHGRGTPARDLANGDSLSSWR